MTEKQFYQIVQGLKAVYADPKYIADEFAMSVWYDLLKDLPYDIATMAVQRYMQTETYPPKPADIRRHAQEITSPVSEDMSEIEAWGLVRKAINNGIYGADKEFARLPKIIQDTLGSPARIREMASLDTSEVETIEQSHFIRNYRARLESHKREQQLNDGLREAISAARSPEPMIEVSEPIAIEATEPAEIPPEIEAELEKFKGAIRWDLQNQSNDTL